MFRNQEDQLYEPRNLFIWFLLAFQGGAINAGGFLSVHRFVSHVTGFWTLAGTAGANRDWSELFGMLFVPLCFISGAMVSAWAVERRRILNLNPRYTFIFSIMLINLSFIAICGSSGFFGEFGEPLNLSRDYFLLFMLSFTCGLQNAVITSASGTVVRTTHMTGITTDLGIGIVRIFSHKEGHKQEIFANWCRLGILTSFLSGSLVGALFYIKFHFFGFYLPVCLCLFVALRLRAIKKL
jgi:uncharacterized membrane protein YoaK (UPF0700 family)